MGDDEGGAEDVPTVDLKALLVKVRLNMPKDRVGYSLRSCLKGTSMLVEQLLSFHAFCKYGGSLLTSRDTVADYQKSLFTMMSALKEAIGRGDSTRGFKLQKFVECSHFLKEHLVYGPTVGHNSDTGERGLKLWGKKPAKTAQKRSDAVFKGQVTRNLQQSEILDMLQESCMVRMRIDHDDDFVSMGHSGSPGPTDGPSTITTYGKNFVFQLRVRSTSNEATDMQVHLRSGPGHFEF